MRDFRSVIACRAAVRPLGSRTCIVLCGGCQGAPAAALRLSLRPPAQPCGLHSVRADNAHGDGASGVWIAPATWPAKWRSAQARCHRFMRLSSLMRLTLPVARAQMVQRLPGGHEIPWRPPATDEIRTGQRGRIVSNGLPDLSKGRRGQSAKARPSRSRPHLSSQVTWR